MAKKKHPIFRLHKIKIHHNRWLIWAMAYALFVAIALVGYINVSEIQLDTQNPAENVFVPWHSYINRTAKYSLRYPADWSIEALDSSTVNFLPADSADEGVSVSVLKPSAETAIRKGLKKTAEVRVAVDGNNAVKIQNSLGSGHYETVIIALHNRRLYVLRGTEAQVQKLLLTFNFLN